MPAEEVTPLRDLEEAGKALDRVSDQIEAQDPAHLAAMNVDLLSAVSIVIGRAKAIQEFRNRAAALPEFDIKCFDFLVDYANAVWLLAVVSFPAEAVPREYEEQTYPLRNKLLMWAEPLAGAGIFSQASVDKIKEGTGLRDAAGDLVALVALFRSRWNQIKTMCGITEEDLERAAKIGPAVFASVSQRENAASAPKSEQALRLHKSWTLLDRAYTQCRRAIDYLHFDEGGADEIAPSLRRNAGTRRSAQPAATPPATPEPAAPPAPAMPAAPAADGNDFGGGGSPFTIG